MLKKTLLLLTLFAALPLCAKPITITALYNTKGPEAVFAKEALQGTQLAVAMINKRGGVLRQKITLSIKSIPSNPKELQTFKAKLASDASSDFVVGLNDPRLLQTLAPALLNSGKLVISSDPSNSALQTQFAQSLFLTSFNDKIEGAAAAQYIMSQMHLARAFILYQSDMLAADGLDKNFSAAYQHLKGEVVGRAALDNGKLTPKIQGEIESAHPNILYIVAKTPQLTQLIKQLRTSGAELPIMATRSAYAEQIIPLGKSIADNIYYTTPGYFDKNFMDDAMIKFIAAYRKGYHAKPSTIYSALGYDNVQLLAAAIKKAKSTNPVKVATALKAMKNFAGVAGELDMRQTPPTNIVTVVKILNAKARTAAMVIPQYIPN